MSLFQPSVLKSYLKQQNTETLNQAWHAYTAHFHNPTMQAEIREMKEEEYQSRFLTDLFVNVLGYTLKPSEGYNLVTELKNVSDSKKADGAVKDKNGNVLAVIELKGTNTPNLDKIQQQAFGYKNAHKGCQYVITSNFEKLRFYISDTEKHLEFNLFTLTREQFNLLWLCIAKENIFSNTPFKVKQDTVTNEAAITKKLYKDYQAFRTELFNSLVELNEQFDKMLLFKKTQKLLDRFLFIFFAEDRQLLPANSITKIIKNYEKLKELDFPKPLYEVFKQYFHFINTGRKKTDTKAEIFPYNGGLFKPDEVLDNLKINDVLLLKHASKLTAYDFESEVSVNILGHIFEHSLNDLEEMQAQIEGTAIDTKQTKRKKDGVFYTPQYITQYIVENTVGKLCEEKKTALNFEETEYTKTRKGRNKKKLKELKTLLDDYRTWLTKITICDPACGSGAFLNEALQFLMKEHKYLDELETNLLGGGFVFPNVEKTILENNLFGVDINNESVEIAKLSLWLSTAAPNRKLSSLNNNIKCGNSLIDDVEVAGEKAFNWQHEFPQVFKAKQKQAFHVVLTTHNSRTSQRMIDYKVEKGEAIELNLNEEIALTTIIGDIITESNFNCLAYNVCKDHVHLILVCEPEELSQQVKTIKGKSAYLFNRLKPVNGLKLNDPPPLNGFKPVGQSLWSQKFFKAELNVWELNTGAANGYAYGDAYIDSAINYIQTNRQKHELPESEKLNEAISQFVTTPEKAFTTEYSGGFDVVIGNPPYGVNFNEKEKDYLTEFDNLVPDFEIYIYFISLYKKILKSESLLSYIFPNTFLSTLFGINYRKDLFNQISITEIVDLSNDITFSDAAVRTIIFTFKNSKENYNSEFNKIVNKEFIRVDTYSKTEINVEIENVFSLFNQTKSEKVIISKVRKDVLPLEEIFETSQGLIPYDKYRGHDEFTIKNRIWHSEVQKDDTFKKELKGGDINAYNLNWNGNLWISYGNWLAAPRKPKYFMNNRILVREITAKRLFATYTELEYYNTPSLINIIAVNQKYNLKYLLSILNSGLIGWYHNKTSPKANKGLFPKILVNDIRKLPIKHATPEQQQPFIEKTDEMLSLNETFNQKKNQFLKLLQANFEIEKLSKKLQAYYNFDFKTLVAELKKKKVVLGLAQQAEWMEFFEQSKTEINALQSQIAQTDKTIDEMVYQLYGLTPEEIAIVEAAV